MESTFTRYLSRVCSARSASVSHLSAISIKNDLCPELRADSANRMHSAALLRNWTKLGRCASISIHMGTDRALCPKNDFRSRRRGSPRERPGHHSEQVSVMSPVHRLSSHNQCPYPRAPTRQNNAGVDIAKNAGFQELGDNQRFLSHNTAIFLTCVMRLKHSDTKKIFYLTHCEAE
jgi:hypothetical protein